MTLNQAIKKYDLKREFFDFMGRKFHDGFECYTSKKETEKAIYFYTAERDLGFCDMFFLTIVTYYKTRNQETVKNYILDF